MICPTIGNPHTAKLNTPNGIKTIAPITRHPKPVGSGKLKEVNIPDNVATINDYAISGFEIAKITLPSKLKEISTRFATSCTYHLRDIYCPAITPAAIVDYRDIDKQKFQWTENSASKITLHVYPESETDYRNAVGWKDFNIVADLDKVMGITDAADDAGSNAVVVADGAITVDGASDTVVSVYTVDGHCVYNGGAGRIGVSPGLYVVNVGRKAVKVVVR